MTFVRFYCTSSFGLFWRGISCSLSAISINEIYFGSFLLWLLLLAVKRLIWLGRVYRVSSCFVFRTCHVFGNCRIFSCLQNLPRFWDLSFCPDVSRTCHVCTLFMSDIHTIVIFLRHCTMLGPTKLIHRVESIHLEYACSKVDEVSKSSFVENGYFWQSIRCWEMKGKNTREGGKVRKIVT